MQSMYLVMDNTYCCFFPLECFEIIEDQYGILFHRSVYYSYNGNDEKTEY